MSLQCDNLSGELQDQWSSSFETGCHVSLMVINALKSTKYKVEKVGVWYICASTFICGLKIFYLVESKKL